MTNPQTQPELNCRSFRAGVGNEQEGIIKPQYSTAGFFQTPENPREVYNFGTGWRFFKGTCEQGHSETLDDSNWQLVNAPHSLELLPEEASGSINYQGEAWYRKHFDLPSSLVGKRIFINFEAIQGKSKIWVNGQLLKENYEGFLSIVLDITEQIKHGETNQICVMADNSDDPSYPAGKPQNIMDFTYAGGIYRDVWLYATHRAHITNSNLADKVAGGGIFVSFDKVSNPLAKVRVKTHIANSEEIQTRLSLRTRIRRKNEEIVAETLDTVRFEEKSDQHFEQLLDVESPILWHPDAPYLHYLDCELISEDGQVIDGMRLRIGIRSIEFRGNDGLYINNRPFKDKLIGVNRHQYHAYIGMALSNSMHWRDVKKLRDAGMQVIRTAHYPQDPAFMDAADELGMLLLVPSIGWQFWNDDPLFISRAKANIRHKIRRDRNHASVMVFEPALNETHMPGDFVQDIYHIVHEEQPYSAAVPIDSYIEEHEFSDIIYAHPNQARSGEDENGLMTYGEFSGKSIFTREWGDNVDDWNSHNSNSRVHRSWGEQAQIIQAMHYAVGSGHADHQFATNLDVLFRTPRQHVGGTLWHGFDHQRGYHPEQFWGGIMDAFRQPKYSYDVFKSQRDPKLKLNQAESGYNIRILHELTPISGADITVFSNADEVRLTVFGQEHSTIRVRNNNPGIPFKPAIFKNAYNFMDLKTLHRSDDFEQAFVLAEGLVDGEVVCKEVKFPAKRPTRIQLELDNHGIPLIADGSDMLTVIASITDDQGNVKRLARNQIRFTVLGEAELVGGERIGANPRTVEWGTAPALIRASHNAGEIRIQARANFEGANTLVPAELVIHSVPASHPELTNEIRQFGVDQNEVSKYGEAFAKELNRRMVRNHELRIRLKNVETQQTDCGETEL